MTHPRAAPPGLPPREHQRTRLKNQVQAILHRNLTPRCPATHLFGVKARCWFSNQHLPAAEELAVDALLRQIDFTPRSCGSSTPRWGGSLWNARWCCG